MQQTKTFLGIDVGTSGARVMALTENGELVAQAASHFAEDNSELPKGWAEQEPRAWWEAARACLRSVAGQLQNIEALSVTSTSGTFVPVDGQFKPLRPALMYNDGRAGVEAKFIETLTHEHSSKLGYAFAPSFSLPKVLWLMRNEPQIYERTARFLHAGDYIVHKLTGEVYSDPSTALKTGYDPLSEEWPAFIESDLGIERDKLPPVKKSGTIIGTITKETAQETGLPEGIPVCLGTTDGVASLIASGAASPGDWCSTLGTTLVVRGISGELVRDPLGRVYSHRHPDGWWMPGGASNIGGECLQKWFAGEDFTALDEQAQELLPIQILSYPLARKGERLPFLSADAEGFFEPVPQTLLSYYAACLQGVALTERWIWDLMHELGASVGSTVFAAGGGCKSALWMQLRTDVTQKSLQVAAYPEAAAGAAILSASTHFGTLHTATKSMTQITQTYTPASNFYDELYTRFREVCAAVYSL